MTVIRVVREEVRISLEARRLHRCWVAVEGLSEREKELIDRIDFFSIESFLTTVIGSVRRRRVIGSATRSESRRTGHLW